MLRKLSRKNYVAKIISRKALPSVLLHKSEVTYRDTGVSKNWPKSFVEESKLDFLLTKAHMLFFGSCTFGSLMTCSNISFKNITY